ncbi:MAG: multiheme c-type cytochrome, partial [Gammaproteobacteria bacterium]
MKHKLTQLFGAASAAFILAFSQAALATDGGRTTATGPGDDGIEVIAGTGYTHTVFDSAEKKCQNCHNDLYDTWKKSMHAQSWVDPLFQVKYQDFLRLQVSKIGATGPTGTYKESTLQKSSQVCIKCHAPNAYYSGDYEV